MSLSPKEASLYVLGGAVAMVFLENFLKPRDPGKAQQVFLPPEPDPSAAFQPAPAPARPSGPVQIQGPVQAVQGALYRATIVVHFPLSMAASSSKGKAEAEKQGFTNVTVTDTMPPGWPGAKGDYYVTGMYAGGPKTFERSAGGGQVSIADVWQG